MYTDCSEDPADSEDQVALFLVGRYGPHLLLSAYGHVFTRTETSPRDAYAAICRSLRDPPGTWSR